VRTFKLLAACGVIISCSGVGLGQQVGDTIVVTAETGSLRDRSDACGAVPQGEILEVEEVDHDLFWVVWTSNKGTVMGWISRSDVVPLSQAVNFIDAALKRNPTARAYAIRGRIWCEQHAYDKALADFGEAIRLDPKMARVWSALGLIWSKNERAHAAANFQEAIRLDPKDPQIFIDRGGLWLNRGRFNEAVADFDRAITLDPQNPDAYTARGLARFAQNRFEAAIADFDQAIALDKRNAEAYKRRGIARLAQNNVDAAIADINQAIRLNPRDADAYSCHAVAVQSRDEGKSLSDLSEAIRIDPTEARHYRNRAYLLFDRGQYDKMLSDLNEAIRLEPKHADSYVGRGLAWYAKGEYDRAISEYNEALWHDPNNVRGYFYRGDAQQAKGQYNKAIADYEQTIQLAEQSYDKARAYKNRGLVRQAQGEYEKAVSDYDQAISAYREAIQDDPTDARACVGLGDAARAKADFAEAASNYDQAVQFDPRSAVARNSRAWFVATCAEAKYRDGTKAVADATRACELTSWNDVDFLSTLAAAYAERGDFSSAIKWEEKAIAIASQEQQPKLSARLEAFRAHKAYRQ
jgi:tetratricopeptide (TPR) repeat protein